MLLFSARSLNKSFGPRKLFSNISLSLEDSDRAGLIGPNGAGKSTFLKILCGLEHADDGTIETKRNLKLAYVPQQEDFPVNATPEQILLSSLGETDEHLDDTTLHTRASIILSKLNFPDPHQPAATLSGGWRKRLSLARQLVKEPDLLLLDEPTNHLDLEGILWLEKLLKNAPFAFLVISHDRYFLENTTNRTIELSPAYDDGYLSAAGPYSEFLVKKDEYLAAQSAQQTALASRVRREVEWLRRGAKARTTKAKGRIDQADQMMRDLAELKTRNTQSAAVQIDFAATHRQTRKLLVAKDVKKSLGGRLLFDHLNLVLSPGTKLGLLGPNGSGKTTLIRLLSAELPADSGNITPADGLRTIVFHQSRHTLDPNQTLRRALSPHGDTLSFNGSPMHVSAWARRFLFPPDQLDLPLRDLSGGEQARVLIADLMRQPADLLILDEPTNDLDIPSLEVLEDSLLDFPGALILVTHDRFLLDRVSTEILGLDGQGGAHLYADYSQYERAQSTPKPRRPEAQPRTASSLTPNPSPLTPPKKRLTYMEQRELEQMEDKITDAESSLHAAQQALNDPAVLANRDKLHDACTTLESARQRVQSLYARWEDLESRRS